MTSNLPAAAVAHARGFLEFVNKAVTPFHATAIMCERLSEAGYTRLRENEVWPALAPGGKFFVTRSDSSLIAFAVGGNYKPGCGIKIAGAHTDSPNLAVKPNSRLRKHGYAGVGVQAYGGGLWHTWFDRDLTVAGRVVYSTPEDTRLRSELVHVRRPILRIPNLAIHLTSAKEREGFSPNKETNLAPIMAIEETLGKEDTSTDGQCPTLFKLLAEELKLKPSDIVDFDLSLVDTQPAELGGLHEEFVFAPRIDNLLSCYCALEALLDAEGLADDDMVRLIGFFDHEEVGSESAPGAGGSLIPDIVERLQGSNLESRTRAVANSFLLSVDGAHGLHPNYSEKHEPNHRPMLHQGPVIKYNANQRYSTSGETAAVVGALARRADVPVQKFCVKNDSPCGSTIGPIMTALSGIRGADIGNAMLSMHSIREMCGTIDVQRLTRLIKVYFTDYKLVAPQV